MNKQVEANLSMVVSKALGGLNMNALKYLLPLWIAPVTGVTFRLVFGAAAFWLIDIFCKPEGSHYPSEMAAFYVRGFRYLRIYVFLSAGYQ